MPPVVEPYHLYLTVPDTLSVEQHRSFDKSVFSNAKLLGYPEPTPEDVRDNALLAVHIVLGIFQTRGPGYHVRKEFQDFDNLFALVKQNDLLREHLGHAVMVRTFSFMRRLGMCFSHPDDPLTYG